MSILKFLTKKDGEDDDIIFPTQENQEKSLLGFPVFISKTKKDTWGAD